MQSLRRDFNDIYRLLEDDVLPAEDHAATIALLNDTFDKIRDLHARRAIEQVKSGKSLDVTVLHAIAMNADGGRVMELVALLQGNAPSLNVILYGACVGTNDKYCDDIIRAGASRCGCCSGYRHRQFRHAAKFALFGALELHKDVLWMIKAAYCRDV
jgi:hypothetical protein